ncbi:MAG: hypothetical protein ACJAZ1_003146 [Yoonia sp.]|jgi:hypothetical protein
MDQARGDFNQAVSLAQDWLLSPAAWSQFALLIGAYLLARLANLIVAPRLTKLLVPDAENKSLLATRRRFVLTFLLLFLVRNALKDNDIDIPYPHRVIEIKGQIPT